MKPLNWHDVALGLMLLAPSITFAAGNVPKNRAPANTKEAAVKWRSEMDLSMFLDTGNMKLGMRLSKDTAYYMAFQTLLQKLPGGYLFMPDPARWGDGSFDTGYSPAFLQTSKALSQDTPISGVVYYVGDYSYTAVNGFSQKVPMFRIYDGDANKLIMKKDGPTSHD